MIDTQLAAIDRLNVRIGKLVREREELIKQKAAATGWKPCTDCFNGYCVMNCSSAPTIMQVLYP